MLDDYAQQNSFYILYNYPVVKCLQDTWKDFKEFYDLSKTNLVIFCS